MLFGIKLLLSSWFSLRQHTDTQECCFPSRSCADKEEKYWDRRSAHYDMTLHVCARCVVGTAVQEEGDGWGEASGAGRDLAGHSQDFLMRCGCSDSWWKIFMQPQATKKQLQPSLWLCHQIRTMWRILDCREEFGWSAQSHTARETISVYFQQIMFHQTKPGLQITIILMIHVSTDYSLHSSAVVFVHKTVKMFLRVQDDVIKRLQDIQDRQRGRITSNNSSIIKILHN